MHSGHVWILVHFSSFTNGAHWENESLAGFPCKLEDIGASISITPIRFTKLKHMNHVQAYVNGLAFLAHMCFFVKHKDIMSG